MMWTADDLAAATGGAVRAPFDATGVSIDTRTLRPGDLFVALVGERGDGHDHVAEALAKGAAGALVHRDLPGSTLLVHDTLTALWALGRVARARFRGRMVAVTGSVGKTTTKEMLRTILSAAGPTHAADASYNNHWGVPLTLARLPPDAAYCVAEIGTNHPGEISPLSRLARPHVAVITNVEAAHIGNFGSIEAIADEKSAITDGLEPDGGAVLPADSRMLPRLAVRTSLVDTFGVAQVLAVAPDAEGTDVTAQMGARAIRFRVNAPGGHMVLDALAALTAANMLGIDGSAAMAAFRPLAGRGARRALPSGITLLDESYNANGASIRAALAVLRTMPGRRVAVLGDMLELGVHGPAEHTALAPDVSASADLLFTCGPLMRGLFDAVPAPQRGAHAPDAAALAPVVAARLEPGDAVLVKGSLGSRMATIVRALEGTA
ncbi:MAG: UDP-N-acetylmuramoyl-tripeptide--D-alanyl-D-alanine ligase [Acetobacteraceae bacterium]